jgi:hypothetical protein
MAVDGFVFELFPLSAEGELPSVAPSPFWPGPRFVEASAAPAALVLADPRGFKVVLGAPIPGVEPAAAEAQKE